MSILTFAVVLLLLGLSDARSAQNAHLRPKRQAPTNYGSETLTGMSGSFRSPGYPSHYPLSVEKSYTINFPDPSAYYKVTFNVHVLGIEYQSSCSWDYLLINAGNLPKICGNKDGQVYTIAEAQGSVTAKFYSDYIISDKGFDISYTLEELPGGCSSSPCNQGNCQAIGRYDFSCMCPMAYYGSRCQYSSSGNGTSSNSTSSNTTCSCVNGYCSMGYCTCYSGYYGSSCQYYNSNSSGNGTSSNSTTNACYSSPCQGGWCVNSGSSYYCNCYANYYGSNCEYYSSNSSGNGTSSNSTSSNTTCSCVNGYCSMGYCMCYSGYYGSSCQYYNSNSSGNGTSSNSTTNACYSSPCQGGWCVNSGSSYYCNCYANYYGSNCEYYNSNSSGNGTSSNSTTNACYSSPCQGGWCVNSGSSYYCNCYANYYGSNCEYYSSNSSGNGTSSNSTSSNTTCSCVNGYCSMGYCMCYSGYYGSSCQYYNSNSSGNGTSSNSTTNACYSSPCQGGWCVNSGSSYNCNCYANYYGSNCEFQNTNSGNTTSDSPSLQSVLSLLQLAMSSETSSQDMLTHLQDALQQLEQLIQN